MRLPIIMIAALVFAPPPSLAAQQTEVQHVAGYGDFLVVDGKSVWMTNTGRVEQWGRRGRLASVALPKPCGAMAIIRGGLWVADCAERVLHRVDTRTAVRTHVVATGIADPAGELNVVAGAGSVWVASDAKGEIARVDPVAGMITARIAVAPGTSYLAFGHGALWAVSSAGAVLQRIDPASNRVTMHIALGRQPGFLAAGEGGVWVQEQGDGTLARIDPARGIVSGRVKIAARLTYGDIDTGGGRVWLRTTDDQELVAIDAQSLAIIARLGKPVGSGALRYTPAGLWTSAHDAHSLSWWPKPGRIGAPR